MSFLMYDLTFLIIFGLFITIFLYKRKKKLKREGIMFLYRTQLGIKFIDYFSKKFSRLLKGSKYIIIAMGYISMVGMIYLLVKTVQIFFQFPEFVRIVKIPPLAPLIPYLPEIFKVDFLPPFYFTYWIIAIGIVAVVHEFSHGIFARLSDIKIKSTGFAFLGPFFGAFVEPDEKKMQKAKIKDQLTIIGAGTFSNWVMVLLFILIMWAFFAVTYAQSGVIFNTYAFSIINSSEITNVGKNVSIDFDGGLNLTEIKVNNMTYYANSASELNSGESMIVFDDSPALKAGLKGIITGVNGEKISNVASLQNELEKYNPGDLAIIDTLIEESKSGNINENKYAEYEVILGENPINGKAYLGITRLAPSTSLIGKIRAKLTFFREPNVYYAPKYAGGMIIFIFNLLWWIILINFSVALANMLPVAIFDGGRFFYLTMLGIFKREKIAKLLFKISTYIILGIFALLMLLWAWAFF